jgi:hypothetical protein
VPPLWNMKAILPETTQNDTRSSCYEVIFPSLNTGISHDLFAEVHGKIDCLMAPFRAVRITTHEDYLLG